MSSGAHASIVLSLLGLLLALTLWLPRGGAGGPCTLERGPVALPELPEASGLAVSRRHPGVLWSHNDSGNDAVLFAIDASGAVRARVRVPVRMRDWEDVSYARCGEAHCLYLADIGDNGLARARILIHRVLEPALEDAETATPETFEAAYADGPHNAEALFTVGADLFIVTRDRRGGVYRARVPDSGTRSIVFEKLGELGLAAVSDAEASRDEASVVVRNAREAVLYRSAALQRGETDPYLRIPLERAGELQGEGVALDGPLLFLASEGRRWSPAGQLAALRCETAYEP